MYGWIGKNFYNHRVILTSTIEYDNFQRLRKFRLSEFFLLGFKPVQHSGVSQNRNGTLMNK